MKSWIKCLAILSFLFLDTSCESDHVPPAEVEVGEGTCFDGILNGDEVIVDCGGECPGFCPPSSIGILGGEVRGEERDGDQVDGLQLNPTIEYRLIGPLLIRDEARLSIPAGTVIKVDPNVGAYIAVAQGGSLLISGTPENPVVITSGAENPKPGDWGGIIICGEGPIASSEIGRTDIIDIFYGGSNEESSSGGINYLRVEYAGAMSENGNNFDAVSFYGVGSFTGLSNIQTFESMGNGIRFIGGNADAENLVATNSGKSAIVVQDDWSGNGSSWYLSGISKSGIEITSRTNDPIATIQVDTITDVSIMGPAPEGAIGFNAGGGKYVLSNIFTKTIGLGIQVEGSNASELIDMGNLRIDPIQFDAPTMGFVPTNYTGPTTDFYKEGSTLGAGNRETLPDWALSWTRGFD